MITIKGKQGWALYNFDPYPNWDGDDAMIAIGEKLRIQSDNQVVKEGLIEGPEKIAQLLNALKKLVEETEGVTVTAFRIPVLDDDLDDSEIEIVY